MAKIKQLKEKKTDEIFYPVTVGEAVIFEDGRSVKDKIEKLSTYIETTYSNLKSLRDNNQLIPGALYRITDYVTTTAQEDTRSAGHQFDIIVQAISENVLSEDAKAIQHKFEMPEKCYSEEDDDFAHYDGVVIIDNIEYTKYSFNEYSYLINARSPRFNMIKETSDSKYKYNFFRNYVWDSEINDWQIEYDETSLVFDVDLREFSYFSNSNLAAWKLKYCLDNDESRFAWASDEEHLKQISVIDDENNTIIFNYAYTVNQVYNYLHEISENELDIYYSPVAAKLSDADVGGVTNIHYIAEYGGDIMSYYPSTIGELGKHLISDNYETGYIPAVEKGKGVIYQMIDEYNNNCPYDFKNIQFLRTQQWHGDNDDWSGNVLAAIPNSDIYYYTFSWAYNSNSTYFIEDTSVTSLQDDENEFVNARNNILMEYLNNNKIELNNIILVSSPYYDEAFYPQKNNTFKQDCYNNTFGNNTRDNVFDFRNFNWIVFNDYENNQTFGSVYSVYLDEPTFRKIIFMNPTSGSIKITSILNYPNT